MEYIWTLESMEHKALQTCVPSLYKALDGLIFIMNRFNTKSPYCSIKRLANFMGISPDTIERGYKKMQKLGLVKEKDYGRRNESVWNISLDAIKDFVRNIVDIYTWAIAQVKADRSGKSIKTIVKEKVKYVLNRFHDRLYEEAENPYVPTGSEESADPLTYRTMRYDPTAPCGNIELNGSKNLNISSSYSSECAIEEEEEEEIFKNIIQEEPTQMITADDERLVQSIQSYGFARKEAERAFEVLGKDFTCAAIKRLNICQDAGYVYDRLEFAKKLFRNALDAKKMKRSHQEWLKSQAERFPLRQKNGGNRSARGNEFCAGHAGAGERIQEYDDIVERVETLRQDETKSNQLMQALRAQLSRWK